MDAPPLPLQPLPDPGNDKMLAVLCHVSIFLGVAFLLPLILLLVKQAESPFVAAHAKEVLNFHISLALYAIGAVVLSCLVIGLPLLIGLALVALICPIIAAIKTSEGGFYYYPMTIRFIS